MSYRPTSDQDVPNPPSQGRSYATGYINAWLQNEIADAFYQTNCDEQRSVRNIPRSPYHGDVGQLFSSNGSSTGSDGARYLREAIVNYEDVELPRSSQGSSGRSEMTDWNRLSQGSSSGRNEMMDWNRLSQGSSIGRNEMMDWNRLSQGSNSGVQNQGYMSPISQSLSQGSLPRYNSSSNPSPCLQSLADRESQYILENQFVSSSQESSGEPPPRRARYTTSASQN